MATHLREIANELTKKEDKTTGLTYIINRYLILLYKCFYNRKNKPLSLLFELILPALIFTYVLKIMNTASPIDLKKDLEVTSDNLLTIKNQNQFSRNFRQRQFFFYFYEAIYFDFNQTHVKEDELIDLFKDAFKGQQVM